MKPKIKTFKHNLLHLPDIPSTTIEGSRVYHTPAGDMPSITTVLSQTADHQFLDDWRDRIGEDEAERQTRYAARRGTLLHRQCEDIVLNRKISILPPLARQVYSGFLKEVDYILGVEVPLYSKVLGVAGRCDLIAEYRGKLRIIDYKTSKKNKREDWIEDYFIQASFYSYAFEELTSIRVPNIMVVIGVEQEMRPQLFPEKRKKFREQLQQRIRMWRSKYTS